jgi:RNA recognition motif-containing protein
MHTPRFAFVDFTSTEHATAALIHSKNHQLDGRKLVVEYASADAVRRGGGAGHKPRKKSTEVRGEGHSHRKRRDSVVDEKGSTTTTTAATTPSKAQEEKSTATADRRSDTFAKSKVTNGTRTRKSKPSRPAPGAALALAKREQVAIVPSQGRRITFDE